MYMYWYIYCTCVCTGISTVHVLIYMYNLYSIEVIIHVNYIKDISKYMNVHV